MTGARWEAVVTGDGSSTLRHPRHGESCHSASGAWTEARECYVRGCRLYERLAPGGRRLEVLDVGTGPGLDVAAALQAAVERDAPLSITTLERDRDVLRDALRLGAERMAGGTDAAPWIARVHAVFERVLAAPLGETRFFELDRTCRLRLVLGDARHTLPRLAEPESFDAIFLDGFSPGVEPELWEPPFLFALAERLAEGGWLATYSAATRVRVGLLAAGLRVGMGPRVGQKSQGTHASPDREPGGFSPRIHRRLERQAAALRLRLRTAREAAGNRDFSKPERFLDGCESGEVDRGLGGDPAGDRG